MLALVVAVLNAADLFVLPFHPGISKQVETFLSWWQDHGYIVHSRQDDRFVFKSALKSLP